MPTPKNRTCSRCPSVIYADNKTGMCRACKTDSTRHKPPSEQLFADREKIQQAKVLASLRARYEEALKTIGRQEQELSSLNVISRGVETFAIEPQLPSGTSEATVVWVASDWHVEEKVDPRVVNGLNRHNMGIAKQRATTFFQAGLRLTNLLAQDVKIQTIVLALLGDFISGDIHEEVAEMAEVPPTEAAVYAQNLLISGIEFILEHSAYELVIPCHSGNHGRTTKTTRFAAENGHSLEYLMYLHLAAYFRHEPRVKFIISEGMHSYLKIYGQTLRFHHGHALRYQGGVGGLYIPVGKALHQWNLGRHADLDVFGHFHQLVDGGRFICNGSMIGYNAFALSIKAAYEPPRQALFLLDKKRGRTATWPILFGGDDERK